LNDREFLKRDILIFALVETQKDRWKMLNSRLEIALLLVLLGCVLSACAQLKEAGRIIGHTTRDVATEIGHGTRDAAKAVGEGVKKVVKSATEAEK
jgi:hypothetical protein